MKNVLFFLKSIFVFIVLLSFCLFSYSPNVFAQNNFSPSSSLSSSRSVQTISLNHNRLSIKASAAKALRCEFFPLNASNKKVTWTSNNKKVAAVDSNGMISAISFGLATITVKSQDGAFTDSCRVQVNAKYALEENVYEIKKLNSNHYLNVTSGVCSTGANSSPASIGVIQSNSSSAQRFRVSKAGEGNYTFEILTGAKDECRVVDAFDGSKNNFKDGVAIGINKASANISNQSFYIVQRGKENGTPYYSIESSAAYYLPKSQKPHAAAISANDPTASVSSNKSKGSTLSNGVVLNTYAKSTLQHWQFVKPKPSVSLAGFVPPAALSFGQPCKIGGTITSAFPLTKVSVSVLNKITNSTEIEQSDAWQETEQKLTYSIGVIDSRVKFGTLTSGAKTIEVYASNVLETVLLSSTDFTVNENDPVVKFSTGVNASVVNQTAIDAITTILYRAGLPSAIISSTIRTSLVQATAMYNNLMNTGPQTQKDIYGNAGDQVIDVYVASKKAGKTKDQIIADMVCKIESLWPTRVSNHCVTPADYALVNVVDIGYSSVSDLKAFREQATWAVNNGIIKTFLDEPSNSCFHIEVQTSK